MKRMLLPLLLAFLVIASGCTAQKDSDKASQSTSSSKSSESSVVKSPSSTAPTDNTSKDSSNPSQATSSSSKTEPSVPSSPAPSSSKPAQAQSSGSGQSSPEIIVGPSIEVGVPTEVIEITV